MTQEESTISSKLWPGTDHFYLVGGFNPENYARHWRSSIPGIYIHILSYNILHCTPTHTPLNVETTKQIWLAHWWPLHPMKSWQDTGCWFSAEKLPQHGFLPWRRVPHGTIMANLMKLRMMVTHYHFVITLLYFISLYIHLWQQKIEVFNRRYIYNIILYLSKVWPGKWCTLWTLSSPINNMSIWNLAKWNQLWCARVVTNLWVRLLQASTHVWSSMGGKKSEMLRNHRSWGNVQFLLVWNILKYGHWGYQQRQEVNLSMSSERPHCRAARPNGASYP